MFVCCFGRGVEREREKLHLVYVSIPSSCAPFRLIDLLAFFSTSNQCVKKKRVFFFLLTLANGEPGPRLCRETFPCDSQFNTITKFIIDQTQTPNLKVSLPCHSLLIPCFISHCRLTFERTFCHSSAFHDQRVKCIAVVMD